MVGFQLNFHRGDASI